MVAARNSTVPTATVRIPVTSSGRTSATGPVTGPTARSWCWGAGGGDCGVSMTRTYWRWRTPDIRPLARCRARDALASATHRAGDTDETPKDGPVLRDQ